MNPANRHDLIDQVACWLHAFDGSPLIPDNQLLQQREAYRARATQIVAAVRKFDGSDDHRALLPDTSSSTSRVSRAGATCSATPCSRDASDTDS